MGHILRTHTHTHSAKLVVRMCVCAWVRACVHAYVRV